MQRPTLSTFRAQWPSEATGICQGDPQVAAYCNQSQDELLMDPMAPEEGWWGGTVTLNLTATVVAPTVYVVTPREIGRLTDIAVCQYPLHIRNGYYEYLKWGAGLQPKNCQATGCGSTFQSYERDNVVTFSPLSGTKQIRVYPTDARDTGLRVLLQGKDQNGMVILNTDPGTGQSGLGEYLQLNAPFVTSINQFSLITGIQKDETYGPLSFFQVDPNTGFEYPLSTMEPHEGEANYRRYMINGIPNTSLCCASPRGQLSITAQGRLDFIPVINETDYLIVQNVPALIEQSLSIRYRRMDSGNAAQQSQVHHIKALSLLSGQMDAYEGKTSTAVKVPLFGSNRMRPSFV